MKTLIITLAATGLLTSCPKLTPIPRPPAAATPAASTTTAHDFSGPIGTLSTPLEEPWSTPRPVDAAQVIYPSTQFQSLAETGYKPPHWMLTGPELISHRSRPHDDPHTLELYFIGHDGSKWRPVQWEQVAKP